MGPTLAARRAGMSRAATTTKVKRKPDGKYLGLSVREIPYRKIPEPLDPIPYGGRKPVAAQAPSVPTLRSTSRTVAAWRVGGAAALRGCERTDRQPYSFESSR
jgi:hypothetical protein